MCMHCEQLEKKIAEKNILVTKATFRNNIGLFSFISQLQEFKYWRFKKYKTEIISNWSTIGCIHYVENGFHSYIQTNLKCTIRYAYFIIPKGATYYEGGDNVSVKIPNVRVSNHIIYIGRRNWFTRLIAEVFYKV